MTRSFSAGVITYIVEAKEKETVLHEDPSDAFVITVNAKGVKYLSSEKTSMIFDIDFQDVPGLYNISSDEEILEYLNEYFFGLADIYFPSVKWDAYRTRNGVRIIQATIRQFNWDSPEDINLYEVLGVACLADVKYIQLAREMKNFRSRVSPHRPKNLWQRIRLMFASLLQRKSVYKPLLLADVDTVNAVASLHREIASDGILV